VGDDQDVRVLTDGSTAFNRIIACIDEARESVVVNMFIWRDDPAGNRFGRALLAAADRGVEIVVSKDKLGALFELGEENRQSFFHKHVDLRTAVRLRAINAYSSSPDVFARVVQQPNELPVQLRAHANVTIFGDAERNDHSKMISIDDDVVFVGGLNIEERAVSTDANGLIWRDYLFECRGIQYVSNLRERLLGKSRGQSSFEFVLNDNSGEGRFEIKPCVLELLKHATRSCNLEMAYIGDPEVTHHLVETVNRGVDVQVIIPAWANIQNERNLKTMGELFSRTHGRAAIYLSPDMLHAKMLDVDGQFILAGSANFNERALNEFSELNVLLSGDAECAKEIRRTFDQRREASKKVANIEDLDYRKIKQWCEYIFG
jgi:cardiolipin synthase